MLLFTTLLLLCKTQVFASSENLLLDSHHGGDSTAWGKDNCDACHLLNFIHDDTQITLRNLVQKKGYDSCTGCHGSNGTKTHRQCVICHNNKDLSYSSGQHGDISHNFIDSGHSQTNSRLSDENCLSCHDAPNMDGVLDLNLDLTQFSDKYGNKTPYKHYSDFCLSCHNRDHQQTGFEMTSKDYRDPLIAMEDNYRFIDKHGVVKGSGQRTYSGLRDNYRYPSVVDCTDCHAMHGTHNDKLIIGNAFNGASRLSGQIKQQDISIDSNNGEFSQLCVICHAMDELVEEGNIDTGNGLSGVHQSTGQCRDCHRHGMAVQTGL